MINDTFLFFEFLLLLLMLFFPFESVTIFSLLRTFKVVISCFGMLRLLCLKPNYSVFLQIFVTEISSLLFARAENWFNEAVSWSGMVITWSSAFLFIMSPLLPVSANKLCLMKLCLDQKYHMIFGVFVYYIIFLKVIVLNERHSGFQSVLE